MGCEKEQIRLYEYARKIKIEEFLTGKSSLLRLINNITYLCD